MAHWPQGFGLSVSVLFGVLAGCAGVSKPPEAESHSIIVHADWDDCDAAALITASRCEMGIVERRGRMSPPTKVYELVTPGNETAWLTVRWAGEGDPVSGPIRLEARVLDAPDDPRARRLVGAMRHRLRQLRGVETAPLDAPLR
ncbi:MAG TPA: hypothetical protein VD971_11495 [Phycisphaerales bacterium]|nr:hypothetical protein [Phycisphaerales bacterium]